MIEKAIRDLSAGLKLYHVWAHQAYHEITAKYKRTVLGSLWLSGSVLVTSISLSIIFGGIFGQNLQETLPYVMAGIVCFALPGYVFYEAPDMFMSSSSIIKNHAYPYTYYCLHTASKVFLMFLHNVPVYWIVMTVLGAFKIPHWSILFAIPVCILFMVSWGMVTAMLASRFRDMRFLIPYVGQLLSVITPIFWYPVHLSGWRSYLVQFNPIYGLVEIVRSPLMGKAASADIWFLAVLPTAIGIVAWFAFFSAFRRRIPFWV